jgi:hypothetical protein
MKTIQEFINFMIDNNLAVMIWDWDNCPFEEKYGCGHGGDEDDVILRHIGHWRSEFLATKMAACDNYTIQFNDFELSVTAHS